jgi:hypothetical protein
MAVPGQEEDMFVPGGYSPVELVGWELAQLAGDDGRDPASLSQLRREAGLPDGPFNWAVGRAAQEAQAVDEATLLDIYRRALALPIRPDYPFTEPNDLESIQNLRPEVTTRQFAIPQSEGWLYDRLYGAWLGRCAGCTLGGPSEQWRPRTRERLIEYLTAVSPQEWPITDYLPENSPSEIKIVWKRDATRERLSYVPADDDLTHTVIAQIALQAAPSPTAFRSLDLARTWMRFMPYQVTAGGTSMMALRNLIVRYPMGTVNRARDDSSFDWHWIATHCNPFREDIDGAIRADSYGYAAPGRPELAAALAWHDVRISNVRNGIYCCMFYAAMIAAAFALDDPLAVVEAGLAEIPATSRLYAAAKQVIEICRQHGFESDRIEQVHAAIYETLGDDDCSTPCNMAVIVSALLMGGGDFEKVITYTVMGGFDSDSTAATAGSIAGAMLGASRLPGKWIAPLRDTFYGQIIGYHPIAVSECASRSLEIAEQVLQSSGREPEETEV